jgi:CheY-like chemotaxis protein
MGIIHSSHHMEFPLKAGESMSFPMDFCRQTQRILLIDDDASVLDVTKRMLEHLGYQVIPASNPLDALDLFRGSPDRFDLVITDLSMPHMAGDDLAREIQGIRLGMPVIIHSGNFDRITSARARETGIRHFVPKPSGMKDLARAVHLVLDGDVPRGASARP